MLYNKRFNAAYRAVSLAMGLASAVGVAASHGPVEVAAMATCVVTSLVCWGSSHVYA